MEEKRESGAGTPDNTREWLLQLERRVTVLEREGARVQQRRRRWFWYMAVMVILYLLSLYYTTNLLDAI